MYSELAALDYASLSDSELDDMYATAVAGNDNGGKVGAGLEIVQRLAQPGAFFTQLNPFGATNFPKYRSLVYQASGGLINPPVASASVAASAANLEQGAIAAAKSIGSGAVVIAASAAIIALLIFFRKK